ncbi:YkvA family protein [Mangrovitalea sediminis]|uniref:YkvA family protein n=1 Tax=Mangrovitalea sediminis TaxID=1982043 RepID=UPI001D0CFFCE|nr:YkvA family protein [Mangrovitalea sediminis]
MKHTAPATMPIPNDSDSQPGRYSRAGFWRKVKRGARTVGALPLDAAFTLYLTLRAPETPRWCKTVIIGALGYFISFVDAIPDLTPILGYTDDLSVMLAAIATLGTHVTPEIREQAKQHVDSLLGSDADKGASQ